MPSAAVRSATATPTPGEHADAQASTEELLQAELQAVRHKVAELERVMRGQDSDEEQGEPQEEVTTPVAPQAQATETAAATRAMTPAR